jgi:hypothetical protein
VGVDHQRGLVEPYPLPANPFPERRDAPLVVLGEHGGGEGEQPPGARPLRAPHPCEVGVRVGTEEGEADEQRGERADLEGGGETFDYSKRDTAGAAGRDNGGEFTLRVFESTKPVIAAINGPPPSASARP